MPTVRIAPVGRQQFLDGSGDPLNGGLLFTYTSGTTTKENTYKTQAGSTANDNPIVLDSSGYAPFGIWLTDGTNYKFTLAPSTDADPPTSAIWTEDVITGTNDIPDTNTTVQWVASGFTPTYISSTSFSVTGDQTSTLMIGRRLELTNGGTNYGTILTSTFGSVTTLVMTMDSGDSVDSSISSFKISILTGTDHAVPKIPDAEWVLLGLPTLAGNSTHAGNNTYSGTSTVSGVATFSAAPVLSGVAIEEAVHTEAAHATTSDIWAGGNTCLLSGSVVTFTDVVDAPQAGSVRYVVSNAAHIITDGGAFEVDGNTNYTCVNGTILRFEAKTTSTFRISVVSTGDGLPVALGAGAVVQRIRTQSTANTSTTTTIPIDSTIPQNDEGGEFLTATITPTNTNNLLSIRAVMSVTQSSASEWMSTALFQDSTANALTAINEFQTTSGTATILTLDYDMTAGTESATTFKIRCGQGTAGTCTMNTGNLGNVAVSSLTVTEIKV